MWVWDPLTRHILCSGCAGLQPLSCCGNWTQLPGSHTGCHGGTLLGVPGRQGRRCRHSARWNSGQLMCLMCKVHPLAGLPSPGPYRAEQSPDETPLWKETRPRARSESQHIQTYNFHHARQFYTFMQHDRKLGNKQEEKNYDQGTITEFKHQWPHNKKPCPLVLLDNGENLVFFILLF